MPNYTPSRRTKRYCGHYKIHAAIALLIILAGIFMALAFTHAAAEEPSQTMYVNTETDPLNVREKPNLHAEKVARLERGEAVTVIRIEDGWALVVGGWESGEGWASMKHLSDKPVEEPELSEIPARFWEVEED